MSLSPCSAAPAVKKPLIKPTLTITITANSWRARRIPQRRRLFLELTGFPFGATRNGMDLHLKRKAVVAAVLFVLCVVIGPFGTYGELGLVHRIMYWAVAILGVGFFMSLSMYLALTHPELDRFGWYPRLAAAAIVAGLPGSVVIVVLEGIFRDIVPTVTFGGTIWIFVTLVGLAVGLVEYRPSDKRRHRSLEIPASSPAESQVPGAAFLGRLKPWTGRSLVSLSINDHYLDVVTREGRETLLMRMADAEAELADYAGMRIHRSHWVALDAVERLERLGNRWTAHLAGGAPLPVSRDLAPRLRDALNAKPKPDEKISSSRPSEKPSGA